MKPLLSLDNKYIDPQQNYRWTNLSLLCLYYMGLHLPLIINIIYKYGSFPGAQNHIEQFNHLLVRMAESLYITRKYPDSTNKILDDTFR